jgi:hypothetical protein
VAVSVRDLLKIPTSDQLEQMFWTSAPEPIRRLKTRAAGLIYQLIKQNLAIVLGAYKMGELIGFNLSDIRNASGQWLEIMAAGFYGLTGNTSDSPRNQPVAASGLVYFDGVISTGAVSVTSSTTGVSYSGTAYGTGNGVPVVMSADKTGPSGNCPGSDLVPGGSYSISSTTPQDTTWLTVLGESDESDPELRRRCLDQVQAQGSGFDGAIAAQIRIATQYQVTRILTTTDVNWQYTGSNSSVIPLSATVKVFASGKTGDFSTSWDATVTTTAQKYMSPSFTPALVHCPVQPLGIIGSMLFSRGTDPGYISMIQQGLADYINGHDIFNGANWMTLAELSHQVISVLDSENMLETFQFSVSSQGLIVTDPQQPIATSIGNVFVANLTGLSVGVF